MATQPKYSHRRNTSKSTTTSNAAITTGGNGGNGGNTMVNNSKANDEITTAHMKDRLIYGLVKSINHKCNVTLCSGNVIQGKLIAIDELSSKGFNLIIKSPKLIESVDDDSSNLNNLVNDELIIFDYDFVYLEIADVDFTNNVNSIKSTVDNSSFKTDSDISNTQFKERELQKWVADDNDTFDAASLDDLESGYGNSSNWDQFSANKKMFGIESTYDENLYTTKISKDSPHYKELFEKATRLAKEIENDDTYGGNIHMAEERGLAVDDSGIDEEDKYSGVMRDDDIKKFENENLIMGLLKKNAKDKPSELKTYAPGTYIPPSKRAAVLHNDPAVLSSSAVNKTNSSNSTSGTPQPVKDSNTSNGSSGSAVSSTTPSTIPKKPTTNSPASPSISDSSNRLDKKLAVQDEINSFKNFSAKFKIPEKFNNKKDESTKKENVQDESTSSTVTDVANASSPATTENAKPVSSSEQSEPEKQQVVPKKKLDPTKVQTFKMNINSASFTPSGFSMKPPSQSSSGNTSSSSIPNSSKGVSSNISSPSIRNKKLSGTTQWFFNNRNLPNESNGTKLKKLLNTGFSILQSARLESEKKEKEKGTSKDEKEESEIEKRPVEHRVTIVAIEKPFASHPLWHSTIEQSYKSFYPDGLEQVIPSPQAFMPYNNQMQQQPKYFSNHMGLPPMSAQPGYMPMAVPPNMIVPPVPQGISGPPQVRHPHHVVSPPPPQQSVLHTSTPQYSMMSPTQSSMGSTASPINSSNDMMDHQQQSPQPQQQVQQQYIPQFQQQQYMQQQNGGGPYMGMPPMQMNGMMQGGFPMPNQMNHMNSMPGMNGIPTMPNMNGMMNNFNPGLMMPNNNNNAYHHHMGSMGNNRGRGRGRK